MVAQGIRTVPTETALSCDEKKAAEGMVNDGFLAFYLEPTVGLLASYKACSALPSAFETWSDLAVSDVTRCWEFLQPPAALFVWKGCFTAQLLFFPPSFFAFSSFFSFAESTFASLKYFLLRFLVFLLEELLILMVGLINVLI